MDQNQPGSGESPRPEPQQPSSGEQPPESTGFVERTKRAFGKFFGSEGRRAGHRDPDPGA